MYFYVYALYGTPSMSQLIADYISATVDLFILQIGQIYIKKVNMNIMQVHSDRYFELKM